MRLGISGILQRMRIPALLALSLLTGCGTESGAITGPHRIRPTKDLLPLTQQETHSLTFPRLQADLAALLGMVHRSLQAQGDSPTRAETVAMQVLGEMLHRRASDRLTPAAWARLGLQVLPIPGAPGDRLLLYRRTIASEASAMRLFFQWTHGGQLETVSWALGNGPSAFLIPSEARLLASGSRPLLVIGFADWSGLAAVRGYRVSGTVVTPMAVLPRLQTPGWITHPGSGFVVQVGSAGQNTAVHLSGNGRRLAVRALGSTAAPPWCW